MKDSIFEKMEDKGFDGAQMHRFLEKYDLGVLHIYPLTDDELRAQFKRIELAGIELDYTKHYDTEIHREKWFIL